MKWLNWFPALVLIGLVGGLLLGCGAEQVDSSSAGGGTTGFSTAVFDNRVDVAADPKGGLRWDQPTYRARAGDVTFVVSNTSPIAHNFVIQGNGVNATSRNFKRQDPQLLSLLDLKPGEYAILCTVPGHREGGMVAKLIVS